MNGPFFYKLLFLSVFLFLNPLRVYSQFLPIENKSTFSSPQSTLKFFFKQMESGRVKQASNALNMSQLGEDYGKKKNLITQIIFDSLRAQFNSKNLPKFPSIEEKKKVLLQKGSSLVDGKFVSTEISLKQDKKGHWKFSAETITSMLLLSDNRTSSQPSKVPLEVYEWTSEIRNLMPSWMGKRIFLLLSGQWLALFLIIFIGLIIVKISKNYLAKFALNLVSKKIKSFEQLNQAKFLNPLGHALLALFFTSSIPILDLPENILKTFLKIGDLVFTFGLLFSAHYLVDVIARYFEIKASETENKIDDLLVPLLRKGAKFLVVFIGVVAVGESLNLDMKGLLAGLGIGGLAFALAAKDTIGNIFGSITVILDRPFQIGDWVMIDGKIEGTVEEVGLRSTRIRTFYDSLISVPNGQLTNIHIDNFGTRTFRRFTTRLGLEYDTPPEKIESFCEGIRQIILAHKFTRKDYFHVYFNNFADSSLQILVYVFWKVPDWSTELQEKHRLLIDIKRLAKELGVQFAFPTQTLHLFNETPTSEKGEEKLGPISPLHLGKERAGKIIDSPLSPERPRSGEKDLKE